MNTNISVTVNRSFEKLTGSKLNHEKFYIKKVPINTKPLPSYSNNGIEYE